MTTPPDARTVNPGQPVGYHNEPVRPRAFKKGDRVRYKHGGAEMVVYDPSDPRAKGAIWCQSDGGACSIWEICELEFIRDDPPHDDFADRVLAVLRTPAGRAAIAEVMQAPPQRMPDGSYREAPSPDGRPWADRGYGMHLPPSPPRDAGPDCSVLSQLAGRAIHGVSRGAADEIVLAFDDGSSVDLTGCVRWLRRGSSPQPSITGVALANLRPGLYELTFKVGTQALASVGLLDDGRRWYAAATHRNERVIGIEHAACDDWRDVVSAKPIRYADGDNR